jgi:hypothetical protein
MFGKPKNTTDPIAAAQTQKQQEDIEVQEAFQKGITALRDFISPSSLEYKITFTDILGMFIQAG